MYPSRSCTVAFVALIVHYRQGRNVHLVGQVILDKLSIVKTVVHKTQIIDNTFRNFQMEVIAGEENFITVAREHGFSYQLDFSKVYWNPRLGQTSSCYQCCHHR